jgi:putative transposase
MNKEAHFHRRNLPHIYLSEASYFITYRLKGSLPVNKIEELRKEYETKIEEGSYENIYEAQKLFFTRYDDLLNFVISGPAFLCEKNIARIVWDSILFYDKKEYNLICFCIMPNHVHILLTLTENSKSLDKIMQQIKGFSSNKINKVRNKRGSVWQSESYDHIVRDEDEFYRIINYIIYNPVKARLVENWNDWSYTFVSEEIK